MESGTVYSVDEFIYKYATSKDPMMGYEYEIEWQPGDTADYGEDYGDEWDDGEPYCYRGTLPSLWEMEFECLGATDGWEVRSPVGGLNWHKRMWKKLERDFDFGQYYPYSHDGGIHINISNHNYAYPSSFLTLIELHEDWFQRASGRDLNSWKTWCRLCDDTSIHEHVFNTGKEFAYENRMFKAEPELMLPALELSDAAMRLSTYLPNHMSPANLMNFLGSSKKYEHAFEVMKKAYHETYSTTTEL